MVVIAETSKYIFYRFLYSFYCIFCGSLIYLGVIFLAGILITLALSNFFSMHWQDVSKAFFCSTLIMFGVVGIWGLLILNVLGGSYISLIIDELHCILLIIASIVFLRSKPSKLSWLWSILLLLFAWPIIKEIVRIIALNANIVNRTAITFVLLSIILLIQALVMMFSLRRYLKGSGSKRMQFLLLISALLLVTHECGVFLIAKSEKWFEFYRRRVVSSGSNVEPKKMIEEITNK